MNVLKRNWGTILAWLKLETSNCEQINELAVLLLASQGDYFLYLVINNRSTTL